MNHEISAEQYDRKLDTLVDTSGFSYDDARRVLGPPPYELYDVPMPRYATDMQSDLMCGKFCQSPTETQRAINQRGVTLARAVLQNKIPLPL